MFLNRLNLRNYSSASFIRIVFICRPPMSAKNGLTYALFFDEFSMLLKPLVSASGKLLLAGDFMLTILQKATPINFWMY